MDGNDDALAPGKGKYSEEPSDDLDDVMTPGFGIDDTEAGEDLEAITDNTRTILSTELPIVSSSSSTLEEPPRIFTLKITCSFASL